MTSPDFAKLSTLASQRTARTDKLHAAVGALLSALEEHVRCGDSVRVDGYTLGRFSHRSNVGHSTDWSFCDAHRAGSPECDPQRPVDGEGFLHGDFHAAWRGPSRADLIALAARGERFVAAFAAKLEEEALAVDAAMRLAEDAAARAAEIGGAS